MPVRNTLLSSVVLFHSGNCELADGLFEQTRTSADFQEFLRRCTAIWTDWQGHGRRG